MISEILKNLSNRIAGFQGAVVIGLDGLVVDKFLGVDSEFERLVIEHIPAIKRILSVGQSKYFGGAEEILIVGREVSVLFASVGEGDCFLVLGVETSEGLGKSRYELRLAAKSLDKEISG